MLVYNENYDFCQIFRPRLFSVVQFRKIKTLKGLENLRQQQFWLLSTWQTWTTLLNTPSSFPSLSFTFNHSHLHMHTLSYGHSLTLARTLSLSLSHCFRHFETSLFCKTSGQEKNEMEKQITFAPIWFPHWPESKTKCPFTNMLKHLLRLEPITSDLPWQNFAKSLCRPQGDKRLT